MELFELRKALRYMRLIGLTDIKLNRPHRELYAEWSRICNSDNLTFGVEIEITGRVDIDTLLEHFVNTEIDIRDGYHVFSDIVDYWKIIDDCSCGLEIVSPILQGNPGLEAITKVVNNLQKAGARVDDNCGLHVHIGVGHLSVDHIRNIVKRYANNEHHIDTIMPFSRRKSKNIFCRSIRSKIDTDTLDNAKCVLDLATAQNGDRYYKINLLSFQDYGTIEFRQHPGTLDPVEITNWVKFIRSFVTLTNEHTIDDHGFNHLFPTDELLEYYDKYRAIFV